MLFYIRLKMRLSVCVLADSHNYGDLSPTSIITNYCNIFKTPIWASFSLTYSPHCSGHGLQCSHSRISLTSLELLVHWSNHLYTGHHPLMTSLPSLPSLDSKRIIIITSFHKLSTLLFLLILCWRSLNSHINPILCLFCTCNELAESDWRRGGKKA